MFGFFKKNNKPRPVHTVTRSEPVSKPSPLTEENSASAVEETAVIDAVKNNTEEAQSTKEFSEFTPVDKADDEKANVDDWFDDDVEESPEETADNNDTGTGSDNDTNTGTDSDDSSEAVTEAIEHNPSEEPTQEKVDEWFDNNQYIGDAQKVAETDDSDVEVPTEDTDGWYDPNQLAEIDENTSDEEFEELDENTENDLLEGSQIPEDDDHEEVKSWREESGYPEAQLVSVDNHEEISEILSGSPVYLVDVSDDTHGAEIIPDSAKILSYDFPTHDDEIILDIPGIVETHEDNGINTAILVVGLEGVITKNQDFLTEGSISREIVVDRARDIVRDAAQKGISVIVYLENGDNESVNRLIQEVGI